MKVTSLGIVGNGVVGSATARAFLEYCDVKVYDIDAKRRTHDFADVMTCAVVMIALPTPAHDDGRCNTSVVEGFLADRARRGENAACMVIRSTVPIGFTRRMAEKYDLPNLVHSPEFLTARCAMTDAQIPARNVIGHPNRERDGMPIPEHPVRTLYRERFPGVPIYDMDSNESEAVKLCQNSFFAAKVALFNEFQEVCARSGCDWETVRRAILADGRISPAHTAVPGPDGKFGYGGECLDPSTPINTVTGWVPLEDVEVGDVVCDDSGTTTVTGKTVRTVPLTLNVRARGRDVTGSLKHIHFTVKDGSPVETLLEDIRPGDWVWVPQPSLPAASDYVKMPPAIKYAKSWRDRVEWTPELAWAVGLWIADGSRGRYEAAGNRLTHVVEWSLGEAKTEQASRLCDVLNGLGLDVTKKWKVTNGTYGESRTWNVRTRVSWFWHFMEAVGVGAGSLFKRAPILCRGLAENVVGGWLDGDGSYTDGTVCGYSESTNLIRDMDRMMLGLGVCAGITKQGRSMTVSARHDTEMVCSWTTRHKFDSSRYKRDLLNASPTLRKLDNGWAVTVQSVTMLGAADVVAIETESGRYIANGHATHNCLPKDIANFIHCTGEVGAISMMARAARDRNQYHDRGRTK